MFFETDDFSIKIRSVLLLSWGERNQKCDLRNFHALSFRVVGNAELMGERGNIRCKSGDITFIPAKYMYTLRANDERVLAIHFETDGDLPYSIKKFTPKDPKYYESKFCDIYNIWTKKQAGYEHACKSIFYRILAAMEKEWNCADLASSGDKLQETLDHIHENFGDPALSVESLASRCSMSTTYFRKLFSERYGVPPRKYINQLRLSLACELLQSDYYTVEEISARCGFNNVNYFSLFVKQNTGMPPSVYRKSKL